MQPLEYFDTYERYAVTTQKVYGVPASITLAQSALEGGFGTSPLFVIAKNSFGIKDFANDDWNGASYNGYRMYNSIQDSFNDHAYFLRVNSNYNSLFNLDVKDYKGWAFGLKAAGYAQDPNYANKLIQIIETYSLNRYDSKVMQNDLIQLGVTCVATTGLSIGYSFYKGWFKGSKNIVFTILSGVGIGLVLHVVIQLIINFNNKSKWEKTQ